MKPSRMYRWRWARPKTRDTVSERHQLHSSMYISHFGTLEYVEELSIEAMVYEICISID